MNGPQHYRMAEQLLAAAEDVRDKFSDRIKGVAKDPMGPVEAKGWDLALSAALDAAQVHATLAQAAATVDTAELGIADEYGTEVVTDWGKATGVER